MCRGQNRLAKPTRELALTRCPGHWSSVSHGISIVGRIIVRDMKEASAKTKLPAIPHINYISAWLLWTVGH